MNIRTVFRWTQARCFSFQQSRKIRFRWRRIFKLTPTTFSILNLHLDLDHDQLITPIYTLSSPLRSLFSFNLKYPQKFEVKEFKNSPRIRRKRELKKKKKKERKKKAVKMPPLAQTPALISLLKHSTDDGRRKSGHSTGFFKMFKLLPMLSSGCKMVALLGRHHNRPLLTDRATTVTLFGHRRGRLTLAIQEDTRSPPVFLIELPMQTTLFHKEMSSGLVKLALESETRTNKRKLVEEFVWAVYCNGRKSGYSIRRKEQSDSERYVMQLLRGVSMGAGVLPCASEKDAALDGELTYMRARFERVVGSKDSEAFYMINPNDGSGTGAGTGGNNVEAPELSIFLVRVK